MGGSGSSFEDRARHRGKASECSLTKRRRVLYVLRTADHRPPTTVRGEGRVPERGQQRLRAYLHVAPTRQDEAREVRGGQEADGGERASGRECRRRSSIPFGRTAQGAIALDPDSVEPGGWTACCSSCPQPQKALCTRHDGWHDNWCHIAAGEERAPWACKQEERCIACDFSNSIARARA